MVAHNSKHLRFLTWIKFTRQNKFWKKIVHTLTNGTSAPSGGKSSLNSNGGGVFLRMTTGSGSGTGAAASACGIGCPSSPRITGAAPSIGWPSSPNCTGGASPAAASILDYFPIQLSNTTQKKHRTQPCSYTSSLCAKWKISRISKESCIHIYTKRKCIFLNLVVLAP